MKLRRDFFFKQPATTALPHSAGARAVGRIDGGLRSLHADDDALLEASHAVFDALYTTHRTSP